MSRTLWKILVILSTVAFATVGTYIIVLVWQTHFFRGTIVKGITIVQRPFKSVYDLGHESQLLVADVNGWVVTPHLVYGTAKDGDHFVISRESFSLTYFTNPREFDSFLEREKLPIYDMKSEEGIFELKYGFGRNRKYFDK